MTFQRNATTSPALSKASRSRRRRLIVYHELRRADLISQVAADDNHISRLRAWRGLAETLSARTISTPMSLIIAELIGGQRRPQSFPSSPSVGITARPSRCRRIEGPYGCARCPASAGGTRRGVNVGYVFHLKFQATATSPRSTAPRRPFSSIARVRSGCERPMIAKRRRSPIAPAAPLSRIRIIRHAAGRLSAGRRRRRLIITG